jgi:hypothetical protein
MQTGPAILQELHLPNAKTTNLVDEHARNFIIFDRSVMAFSRQRELKDDAEGSGQGVRLWYLPSNPIAGDPRPA